ncbi:MAG: hypothetical protein C6W58_13845 [Bacillaceae bacterium]|jgi:Yip1 domain.|uniref:Yip1 domain-containing protein n=1 Tax=Aeribacillus pallidus TaxID=33936 RepID=A0A165XE76_9BACI|nr:MULTISPECIES: YIP1 family protein [Aeribacillus]REJ13877.1 MAG: hypothetical protein C6W58_13845 [Bacillaceae bacterium]KZN95929.1 hypothetical protein AZI98_11295 [Aeribacillus pallidus]MDR9797145.1 YIP1 family protein [Aeribacillus pallidus]MED0704477.1 YIP1 family protein [Aeribacillus composti]REJ23195.1 MAG: hypothetical protein C6W54_14315 [Bacillaceae bacterium]
MRLEEQEQLVRNPSHVFIKRIFYPFKIIYSPQKTLLNIHNEKKLGILATLTLVILFAAISIVISQNLLESEYIADLLGNNPSQSFKNALTIFAAIMQVFLFFVNILLLTALIKIVLSIVKLKVKFRELLRFVIIAQSPVVLGLGIKYVLSDPSQYHIPVTSLAYLFSGLNMNQFLQIFLSKIELFNLWSLFLICLSLTIVTKQSLTKIVSILFPVTIIFNTLIELI